MGEQIMTSKNTGKHTDPTRAEEAASLAKEAVEEQRQGHKEEAEFLKKAAQDLDKQAADAALKTSGGKS